MSVHDPAADRSSTGEVLRPKLAVGGGHTDVPPNVAIAKWLRERGVFSDDQDSSRWLAALPDLVGDQVAHLARVIAGMDHHEKRATRHVFGDLANHTDMPDAVRAAARAASDLVTVVDIAAGGSHLTDNASEAPC